MRPFVDAADWPPDHKVLRTAAFVAMQDLIDRFTTWALDRADIRSAMIVGSRARADRPADSLSDLDLAVIVTGPSIYLSDTMREWVGLLQSQRQRNRSRSRSTSPAELPGKCELKNMARRSAARSSAQRRERRPRSGEALKAELQSGRYTCTGRCMTSPPNRASWPPDLKLMDM